MAKKINKLTSKISSSFLVAHIVGFIFISILPTLFGFYEESFTIIYRAIILGWALLIIALRFLSKVNFKQKTIFIFFVFFWLIYSIRIIYDLLYKGIDIDIDKTIYEYLLYAFGVSLIPSIGIILMNHKTINFDWVLKLVYRVLFFSLLYAIIIRNISNVSGRSVGEVEIGVLLFGQFGTTLSLLSLFIIANKDFKLSSLFYIVGFLIGFIAIIISASKSPFLALAIVTAVFFILRYGFIKSTLILVFFGLFIYIYIIEIGTFLGSFFNSSFIDRLIYAIEEGDSSRFLLYKASIVEFIDNPFFGSGMLIKTSGIEGSYPHNLILEAFMATGIFGGAIFLAWLIRCSSLSFRAIKMNYKTSWIGLLFLQYSIYAMFSSNLFSSYLFWTFSVLVVALFYRKRSSLKDDIINVSNSLVNYSKRDFEI